MGLFDSSRNRANREEDILQEQLDAQTRFAEGFGGMWRALENQGYTAAQAREIVVSTKVEVAYETVQAAVSMMVATGIRDIQDDVTCPQVERFRSLLQDIIFRYRDDDEVKNDILTDLFGLLALEEGEN